MTVPNGSEQVHPSTAEESMSEAKTGISVVNPNAAGIDVGADYHWVSVPEGRDSVSVRRFACFTADLHELANWLQQCGIETVAMESTGVYWIPLFQILETAGLEVKLVNARHVQTVPGRKSDVMDCQWLRQLHSYGLLSGSFRPNDQTCVLRSYIRQRESLIQSASAHIQRMQKALTQMNVQLHRVISDISGTTGLAILRAIVAGERDLAKLAALKDARIKATHEEISAALNGDYRRELMFILAQELQLYDSFQTQIAACDAQIEQCLNQFSDQVDVEQSPLPAAKRPRKKPPGNAPSFDLRTHLYRISGVDFTQVDGLGGLTVLTLLSELGVDGSRFPSAKHFVSWLGLCPGSRITGGKRKSSKTRQVANRAATAFRIAALSLERSQSALGAFHRKMKARMGAPKAITATAHKLARIFYQLWTSGQSYVDPGIEAYEQKFQERALENLKKKALALGFDLTPATPAPEGVS